jgi:Mn2+/Fe2+ NRAMP family transporter
MVQIVCLFMWKQISMFLNHQMLLLKRILPFTIIPMVLLTNSADLKGQGQKVNNFMKKKKLQTVHEDKSIREIIQFYFPRFLSYQILQYLDTMCEMFN